MSEYKIKKDYTYKIDGLLIVFNGFNEDEIKEEIKRFKNPEFISECEVEIMPKDKWIIVDDEGNERDINEFVTFKRLG
jgi:hypothetical protein